MCFAAQRRIFFTNLYFRKWSEHGVFCTLLLPNVLRATTVYTFPHLYFRKRSEHGELCTLLLPNVLRATSACNCSSVLWPATAAPAAFASLTFDPPELQNTGKNTVFRDFLHLLSSPFWLSPRPCFFLAVPFLSLHIVGSLASKLPSTMAYNNIQWYQYDSIRTYGSYINIIYIYIWWGAAVLYYWELWV